MTKQGRHGTLYRFHVMSHDALDNGAPANLSKVWAYDADHAWEIVRDSLDAQGFEEYDITRVDRVKAAA